MKLTEEQKEEITEMAKLSGISKEDIAIVTGIEYKVFKKELLDKSSDIYKAFNTGIIQNKVDFAQKVRKLAMQGSAQAQNLIYKMDIQDKYNELNEHYGRKE